MDIYLKKFKVAFGIIFIAILLVAYIISKVVPVVQNISNIQTEYKTQLDVLAESENKLTALKAEYERKSKEENNVLKAFFKPIDTGLDTEAVMSDEFGEILQLLRENKIKARSVKYEYDPQDDNFVKNAGHKYSACRIDAEMIANYANFEKFLRDLYKHEHFLEISKVEILPYEKNKRILLINLQLKLYAQKAGSPIAQEASQPPAEPQQAQPSEAQNNSPEAPAVQTEGAVSPELAPQ